MLERLPRISERTISNSLIPVDEAVDRVWGEPVVLKPMSTQSGGYREAIPDTSRMQVIARGIFDQSTGIIESAGGTIHTQATVDTSLSIREEPVMQCGLRKGDFVYFPDRDETHEVTFIHEDPGGRPDVHLVRVLV
jgi:hypothetical protein